MESMAAKRIKHAKLESYEMGNILVLEIEELPHCGIAKDPHG